MEIKDEDLATESGICCPSFDSISPDDFKCIIEGANGPRMPAVQLPPVIQKCQKGADGQPGPKGLTGPQGIPFMLEDDIILN